MMAFGSAALAMPAPNIIAAQRIEIKRFNVIPG
jgi:hypothetical protein